MTEQAETGRPQRTPEQQAARDKEMNELANEVFQMPIAEVHAQAAFCLADMLRAIVEGRLKPEDIPATPSEIIVVVYRAISRKRKEMLSGNA